MEGRRGGRGMWWCVVVLKVSGVGEEVEEGGKAFVKSCQRWRDCSLL
jgi:hypothetical protein